MLRAIPINSACFTRLSTTVAVTMVMAGCAGNAKKSEPITEAQACASVQQVLAQAGNGFQSLRGTASVDYASTRWDAKSLIADTDCDIVDWGGGKINYACTWSKGSEATASAEYDQGLGILQRCLGSSWEVSHPEGQTGKATLFSKAGEPARVEVRYYKERDPSTNWQTSLTLGAAVTRDAR